MKSFIDQSQVLQLTITNSNIFVIIHWLLQLYSLLYITQINLRKFRLKSLNFLYIFKINHLVNQWKNPVAIA